MLTEPFSPNDLPLHSTSVFASITLVRIQLSVLPSDASQIAVLRCQVCLSIYNVEVSTYRGDIGWKGTEISLYSVAIITHRITHRMRPPQGDWLGLWSQ